MNKQAVNFFDNPFEQMLIYIGGSGLGFLYNTNTIGKESESVSEPMWKVSAQYYVTIGFAIRVRIQVRQCKSAITWVCVHTNKRHDSNNAISGSLLSDNWGKTLSCEEISIQLINMVLVNVSIVVGYVNVSFCDFGENLKCPRMFTQRNCPNIHPLFVLINELV